MSFWNPYVFWGTVIGITIGGLILWNEWKKYQERKENGARSEKQARKEN